MPDIQDLHDPAGRPEVRDALVFTLRFALSF
ncbi:MAG: carbohydrate-selective porin OprB [Planctomycetota bacterium]|jgi:carbohydrate-selective porin OprB